MMTTYLLEKGSPTSAEILTVPRQSDAGDGSQDADGNPQTKKHFGFSLGCPSWPTSREMLRTHWSFCCKVYARDSRKRSNGKGLFASLLLFWVCFCMQSCFIITGATGLAADDLDLLLQLRGGFALASAILLLGGLVLFRQRGQTTSDTEPVRYLDSVRPLGSDYSGVAARESEGSATTSRDSEGEPREETEAPEMSTDEIQSAMTGDGRRWLSQFLYTALPVCLVFAGYFTAVVSDIRGIAGGDPTKIAYWLYYESIFYMSALMYLNAFRVSVASLIGSVFMLVPATVGGIRADWPGGAIYPSTVLILHLKVVTDLKRYQIQGLEDLKMVEKEHAECESLLNSLLPKEVLLSMQSNTLELAYTYHNMSMLFADIVGFTGYCNKHKDNPSDAVRLVTHLFASFDDCCKLLGAYKVCTIGDAYLAVNEPKTQHDESVPGALVLLHLAMAMLRIIVKVRDEVQHEGPLWTEADPAVLH